MSRFLLLIIIFLATASHASAQAIPATWTSFDPIGDRVSGTLGPVNIAGTLLKDARSFGFPLDGAEYALAPLPDPLTTFIAYKSLSPFKFVFSHPVKGLRLYVINWTPGTYSLDQPFTVISGFTGVASTGNPIVAGPANAIGVIQFDVPITTLNLTPTNPTDGFAEVHFAVVPEPTTLAITGPKKIRTSRSSVTLRGTASATFSIEKVSVKAGKGSAKTAKGREAWSIRLRPEVGRTTVKVNSVGYGGSASTVSVVKIIRR